MFTVTVDVEGIPLEFKWYGGAYIDVARLGNDPIEVICVWDTEKDEPMIPRAQENFEQAVVEWIAEYGETALAHDVATHWYV